MSISASMHVFGSVCIVMYIYSVYLAVATCGECVLVCVLICISTSAICEFYFDYVYNVHFL